MPKLHKRIPLKLVLEKGRFTPPGENLVALEVERCKALPALLPEHLLCMITILVFMRAQGIVLKDTGVQQLGPEILPLRLPGIDTPRWGQLATSRARPYQKPQGGFRF